jgi:ParB-like chromosome segregation protein Spo0J
MLIKKLKLSQLLVNNWQIKGLPKNPRFIKDDRFEKLKKSLKDFPYMLELREIIVFSYDDKFVILWGNQRFRALKELWVNEVICKIVQKNTPINKLREIVIKDNENLWENDFDILINEWDNQELEKWGMEIKSIDFNNIESNENRGCRGDKFQEIICPKCSNKFEL